MGEHEDITMINGGANGSSVKKGRISDPTLRRKTKRSAGKIQKPPPKKPRGMMDRIATFFINNQIRLSLLILGTIYSAHYAIPSERSPKSLSSKLSKLGYYNPATGQYGKGPDDLYYVFYWIVVFTLLRDAAMQYIFMPFAEWKGIRTYKELVRFAEQAWLLVYCTVFWTSGMYITYNSKFWRNFGELWTDFPVTEVDGLSKWYYLAQFAFWLQQIFVLHIEDRRKDHYQMFAHHIITSLLLSMSYIWHMMRVGTTILCLMDVVDILLPAAKILRYLGYQKLCDIAFGIFLITWIVSRHIIYCFVLKSVIFDFNKHITFGCYSIHTRQMVPTGYRTPYTSNFMGSDPDHLCYDRNLHMMFITMLSLLQVITIAWLFMIGKVAYKVITGTGAEDTRSDDEDEDGDGDEVEDEEREEVDEKIKPAVPVDGVGAGAGAGAGAGTGVNMRRADSGYLSSSSSGSTAAGTSALSTLIMSGGNHGGHSGSTHRHIASKLDGGDS